MDRAVVPAVLAEVVDLLRALERRQGGVCPVEQGCRGSERERRNAESPIHDVIIIDERPSY